MVLKVIVHVIVINSITFDVLLLFKVLDLHVMRLATVGPMMLTFGLLITRIVSFELSHMTYVSSLSFGFVLIII